MADLLTALTDALKGPGGFAVGGAFLWGIASVVLSPCHLAGVPLVVAYTGRSAGLSGWRAACLSMAFAAGVMATVAILAGASVTAGRLLGPFGPTGNYLVALLLFAVGLDLLGVWRFRWPGVPPAAVTRRGLAGAFGVGLAFGVALGPCTVAFLGPVMGAVATLAASHPALALMLALAFAIGHCGVLAAAGGAGPRIARTVTPGGRRTVALRRLCGVVVVAGGLYLVYAAG